MQLDLYKRFIDWYMKRTHTTKLSKLDEIMFKFLFNFIPAFVGIMIKASLLAFVFNWVLTKKGFDKMLITFFVLLFIRLDMLAKKN